MRMKFVEIPARGASGFAQQKRFTRKRQLSGEQQVPHEYQLDDLCPSPKRRLSKDLTTFNVVLLLVVSAVVITAYISNIIRVDTLMSGIAAIEKEETALFQQRENIRAEINMLSSYSRIQKEATGPLNLVHARHQPYSLIVPGLDAETADKRTGE